MRNSLVLTTLTAVSLALAAPAMAQDARTQLDAQSTTNAQVQTESKGFFSGLGDRMHGFFNKKETNAAFIETQAGEDASAGTMVQNDTSANKVSTTDLTTTDDTVDAHEEVTDETSVTGTADIDTGADVDVGGVDTGVSIDTDAGIDSTDNDAVVGVGIDADTHVGAH